MLSITTPRRPLAYACIPLSLTLALVAFPGAQAPATPLATPLATPDIFRLLDSDGDGHVAPFEGAEAILALVKEADTSGDGRMDGTELAAYFAAGLKETEREIAELIGSLDKDGNGQLEPSEVPPELEPFLAQVDLNGDGSIAAEELRIARPFDSARPMLEAEVMGLLDEVDHDGDGKFVIEDLPEEARPEFKETLAELDLDDDGVVTRAELSAYVDLQLSGATFTVEGNVATMRGVIGATTPGRVLELIVRHPEVRTIRMPDVPGSMDDEANLRAAMLVHQAGLCTEVPEGGEIASGGVDFFLAGTTRRLAHDARLGVHSWSGTNEEGADLPHNHPEHVKYLKFYSDVGTPAEFYWFTLTSAPSDGIHWMTREELLRFGSGELDE